MPVKFMIQDSRMEAPNPYYEQSDIYQFVIQIPEEFADAPSD